MSASIFEKLLGSYSGMRKRTWSPTIVESTPEGQVKSWKSKFASKAADNNTKKSEYENAKTQISGKIEGPADPQTDEVIQQTITSQPYGSAMKSASNKIYVSTYQGVVQFGVDKAGLVIQALDEMIKGIGEEESEKSKTEKAGEEAVRDSDDKVKEAFPPDEPVKFTDEQKEAARKTLKNLGGMDEEEADLLLLNVEKCINTPSKQTVLHKFFEMIGVKNPTLPQEAKKQLAELTGHLFTIGSHIQESKENGRTFIRESELSTAEKAALKVITIRNRGDIYFGRPEEPVPGYEALQEQASLGDANYGFHLGKALNQLGAPIFGDVRMVTSKTDIPEVMSAEKYDELPKAFLSSKAAASGGNDATGKLTEYFWELGFAIQSGDKAAVSVARDKVKKGLQALGTLPDNLDSLECPITDENFDILDDIVSEIQEAGGIPQYARNLTREIGVSVTAFQRALNIQPEDVVKVDSPAQESKMGERPDVIAFIRPEAQISTAALRIKGHTVKLHVVTPEDTDLIERYGEEIIGTTMLNTSIKRKKKEGGTTRMGSCSYTKMMEPSTEESPSEYQELHNTVTDRLVREGNMTPEQQRDCQLALSRDRAHHKAVTLRLRALTKKNKADIVSFLLQTSLSGGTSIAGRQKYENEAKSIAEGLKSDDPETVRLAELRVVQLARMRRQHGLTTGARTARASAMNDAIGSFASVLEEPIYVDSPQSLRVTTNHQVMDSFAQTVFDPNNSVSINPARTIVYNADGKSMYGLRRVARKGKTPGFEFEMFEAAEAVATREIPR